MGFLDSFGGDIINAGGGLLGAGISSAGNKSAAKTQAKTAADALGFAKQQDAEKLQMYHDAVNAWQQQYQAQQARRDALLAQYGFSVPQAPAPALGGGPGAAGSGGISIPDHMGGGIAGPRLGALGQALTSGNGMLGAIGQKIGPQSLGALLNSPALGSIWSDNKYGLE